MITEQERDQAKQVITDIINRTIRRKKREMTPEEQGWCAARKEKLIAEIRKRGYTGSLDDWWVECERRETGKTSGSYDFYYYSKSTSRKRSVADVARFLGLEPPVKKSKKS